MKKQLTGGVYLVLDPSKGQQLLLQKLKAALKGGLAAVQVWNNWPEDYEAQNKEKLANLIASEAAHFNVPVLVNEEWELLKNTSLDGVHFDEIPSNIKAIRDQIKRPFIAGITCTNNLEVVKWADENGFDYISFCAMFPSSSVDSCEIVKPETVQKARDLTDMPIFLSGGVSHENISELNGLKFNGVAVISGIINAEKPEVAVRDYTNALKATTKATKKHIVEIKKP